MKRLKTLVLVVIGLLCSMSVSAESFKVGGLGYATISSREVKLDDGHGSKGTLNIPSNVSYEGKTYRVTSIGQQAFSYCTGLTSVTIPNSVTSIGYEAFCGCSDLTSVKIPNSVTCIENRAFYGSGLTSVEIPESVTSIGYYTYAYCAGLTSVVIPNHVIHIGAGAFCGCKNMTSLYISSEIKSIGGNAFYECFNLVDILIGAEKVIKIVKEVFSQDTYNKATLYVSYISVADYKATYPWNLFDIIGKEFTDINNVLMNKKGTGGSTVRKGS